MPYFGTGSIDYHFFSHYSAHVAKGKKIYAIIIAVFAFRV
jgi:hypothetical protein